VTLRCEIHPFRVEGTAAYIAARVKTAGGDAARLFSREAVMLIHEHSRGIPRTISVICDNALMNGFALSRRRVDREMVAEVVRDFDLESADVASSEPAQRRDGVLQSREAADGRSAEAGQDAFKAPADEERERVAEAGKSRRFSLFRER
jgi:hypothetical protein